jgi:hypothetical protein
VSGREFLGSISPSIPLLLTIYLLKRRNPMSEEKWEEEFIALWKKEAKFPLTPDESHFRWSKWSYLQACKVRQEEIADLRLKCSHCGLAFTHGGKCPWERR